jgi:hypothetical protein
MKIEILALKFRRAIESAQKEGRLNYDFAFRRFPHGCCGDTSDLLAQYLLDSNIRTNYICGTKGLLDSCQSHAWLETEDHIIIDITGDQFKNNFEFLNFNMSVYVGKKSKFHQLFNVDDRRDVTPNNGISGLGSMCQERLWRLYNIISDYILD